MGHLKPLDGLRGLAVLLVMWSHFVTISPMVTRETAVGRLLLSGFYGVDLFFVLSGFLITGILLDSKGSAGWFRVFFARRVLRIFPLYYFVLAVVFGGSRLLALWHPGAAGHAIDSPWWFWLYVSNWGQIVEGWGTPNGVWLQTPPGFALGHFWSMAVEEQFYLVWPWVVAALDRKKLAWLCLSLLALAPSLAALLQMLSGNPLSAYVSTVGRLNTLGFGALLAVIWREPVALARISPISGKLALGCGVALAAVLAADVNYTWYASFARSALTPVCFGAMLVHAVTGGGGWPRFLGSGVMRFFGKYSYGLYVYHHLLEDVWKEWIWQRGIVPWCGSGPVAVGLFVIAALAASVAVSLLSWRLIESPCLRLKRFFRYRSARPV